MKALNPWVCCAFVYVCLFNLVVKGKLKVEDSRVEHDLLFFQLRLQLVLDLTRVDEQHLRNLLHLF